MWRCQKAKILGTSVANMSAVMWASESRSGFCRRHTTVGYVYGSWMNGHTLKHTQQKHKQSLNIQA